MNIIAQCKSTEWYLDNNFTITDTLFNARRFPTEEVARTEIKAHGYQPDSWSYREEASPGSTSHLNSPALKPISQRVTPSLLVGVGAGPQAEMIVKECQEILMEILDDREKIASEIAEMCELLLTKNNAYGGSVFEPLNIFHKSKDSPTVAIDVRMDDKLARMMRGADQSEDTEKDLIGYLILKRLVAKEHQRRQSLRVQGKMPPYKVGDVHPSVDETDLHM